MSVTTVTTTRGIHWIRGALQTAIAVEHATMPIYAAAMYSLEVQNYPAYNTMRSVLMEEMLHMAAAANMLAALGGRPRIKMLDPTTLTRGFPGHVAPGLRARCARLSRRQLDVFMRIESPQTLRDEEASTRNGAVGYPTIGAFYDAIKHAVIANADTVVAAARGPMRANQVGGNLGYACIDPESRRDLVEQFISSIDLIRDQGEGTNSTRTAGAESNNELSHYARFAELRFGRRYSGPIGQIPDGDGIAEGQRRFFQGEPITWPQVINMLAVPNDGYRALLQHDPAGQQVEQDLVDFDQAYTRMLWALDECWNGTVEQAWPSLGRAVYEMNELRVISCFRVLRHEIPASTIGALEQIYPADAEELLRLTDASKPVFYGPRFRNTSLRIS
jgi:hypothetical protein